MSVFDGCLQQILFPWNALVCCSVCSQWLLLTLTWFDNSSENRVSGATELRCSSRVFASVALQIVWMIGSDRCSSFDRCFGCETCETQNSKPKRTEQSLELLSQFSVDKVNASILDGPSVSFSQRNRWISDSKDDRLICAPICTVSQVHFELQGVASGISYLVSARARGTSLDRHPSPCVRYSRPRKTIWFFNSRNEHVGINHTVSEFSSQLDLLHIEVFLEVFSHRRLSVPMLGTWQKAMSQAVPVPRVLISLRWTLALELLEPWHLLGLDGWICLDGGRDRQNQSMWASLMNWESICHLNPHEIKFQVEAVSMETMTHNAVITACELPSCKTDQDFVSPRDNQVYPGWCSQFLKFFLQRSTRAQNTDQRCVGIINMAGAGKSTWRETRSNPQEVQLLRCRAVDSTSDCDSAAKGIKFITLQPLSFVSVYRMYIEMRFYWMHLRHFHVLMNSSFLAEEIWSLDMGPATSGASCWQRPSLHSLFQCCSPWGSSCWKPANMWLQPRKCWCHKPVEKNFAATCNASILQQMSSNLQVRGMGQGWPETTLNVKPLHALMPENVHCDVLCTLSGLCFHASSLPTGLLKPQGQCYVRAMAQCAATVSRSLTTKPESHSALNLVISAMSRLDKVWKWHRN